MITAGALALIGSLLTSLLLGPALLPWLQRLKVGQAIRGDGPARHLSKAGTPTMGGLVFVPAMAVGMIAARGTAPEAVAALAVAAAFGAIGFLDDHAKVMGRRSLGLRARHKLLLSLAISLALAYVTQLYGRGTEVAVPFGGPVELGWVYVPFVAVVMLSATNAVNLADGIDGLAASLGLVAAAGYAVALWMVGRQDLVPFALALAGACAGFLPVNRHPAAMFMGDVGSFTIGGALGALAVVSGLELLLVVIGGVLVVETLSVIVQVISFKLFGRRVLLMAPLHHHLELRGWSETRIVGNMTTAALLCAAVGILAAAAL